MHKACYLAGEQVLFAPANEWSLTRGDELTTVEMTRFWPHYLCQDSDFPQVPQRKWGVLHWVPRIRRFTLSYIEIGHNECEAQIYGMDCT